MDVFYDYFNRHIDLSAADRSPWIIAAAVVQTLIGFVYLLWGWRVFNIVVMLQAALVGAIVGAVAGGAVAGHYQFELAGMAGCLIGGAIGGAVLFAVLAKYFYRFIFALQAGLCVAALIGVGIETANLSIPGLAVAAIAVVCLLVTAVVVYRNFAALMMAAMSLQGAVFAVSGISMLIAAVLESNHAVRPLTSLIAVVVLATPSYLYQRSRGQVLGQKASGGKSSRSSTGSTRRKAA